MITEKYLGGSFFSWFAIGSQLTIDAGDPLYRDYRYWDNVAFSTTRIGLPSSLSDPYPVYLARKP